MGSPSVHHVFVGFLLCFLGGASAQQSYSAGGGACSSASNTTSVSVDVGYMCSQTLLSCRTYAYYRTQQGQSLADVATLFETNISSLTSANSLSLSSTPSLSADQPLFIPLSCACNTLNYSQTSITYRIKASDTFYKIASSTYQGLTTCSGIQNSNPTLQPTTTLSINYPVIIPLRCACPSQSQLNQGTNLLITYPIVPQDTPYVISSAFGVETSALQSANSLSQNSIIYPQTTVLVPLTEKPQAPPSVGVNAASSQPPFNDAQQAPTSNKSTHVGVYVGIAIAASIVVLVAGMGIVFFKGGKKSHSATLSEAKLLQTKLPNPFKQHMIDMSEIDYKLASFSMEEINAATQDFSVSNHIKGSVYRGMLKDDMVAIKRIERDLSRELSILQRVHHSNLISLLGVCIGPHRSFLVYPLIGKGSLKDWLHEFPRKENTFQSPFLTWSARARIASDIADVIEYLHDYTKPGLLHKNIKSSNILVDTNFRGKLANFGLAKSTEGMEQGLALTRHIEGTHGYLAPEYVNDGLVSSKIDVFAFGVVLLEMLSGEEPIIRNDEGMQLHGKNEFLWESISSVMHGDELMVQEKLRSCMDPMLERHYPMHCAIKMAMLAKQCIAKDPEVRPSMSYVASALLAIVQASERWEKVGGSNQFEGR